MQTAPNNRALSAMQYSDTKEFVRQCNAALEKHGGHRVRAAKTLRVTVRTLLRWCAKYPKILDGINGMYVPTKEEAERRTTKRLRTLRKSPRSAS
jgi:hypothetical protein